MERTTRKLQTTNAKIIIVSSVPEIAFHVPDTAIRVTNGIGKMPQTKLADFLKRQKYVLAAFKKLEKMDNVEIIYPHKTLCNNEVCKIMQNNSPLYKDDDHLSKIGVEMILPEILSAID